MADQKVVINLSTGLEDAEKVTVAFLVAGAALDAGKQVAMFLTKEAVRLALPGHADAVACDAANGRFATTDAGSQSVTAEVSLTGADSANYRLTSSSAAVTRTACPASDA